MGLTLTVLGGGGWVPTHGRHTACALLRNGTSAVMIDAGTGVSRLVERPELLTGVERLDIILTHFHLDHIAGLAYLPALERCPEMTLWGPGTLLYGTPTEDLLMRVSRQPFHPVPLDELAIDVRDIQRAPLVLPSVTVTTRRQDLHSAPTLGLRFDDTLTWITDTAYDSATSAFAEGSSVVAHEAWFLAEHPRFPEIHCSAHDAAEVALAAGVDTLLLVHLPPFDADLTALEAEAQAVVPGARLAVDGLQLTLGYAGTTA